MLAKDKFVSITVRRQGNSLLSRSLLFPTILHADDILIVACVSRVLFSHTPADIPGIAYNHSFVEPALREKCSGKEPKLKQQQLLA
jgi:hypothetical protein